MGESPLLPVGGGAKEELPAAVEANRLPEFDNDFWSQLRRSVRRVVRRRLWWESSAVVDDCTQEALAGFFLACLRETSKDPLALARTIARRVSTDHLRRVLVERSHFRPQTNADFEIALSSGSAMSTDRLGRLAFMVASYFRVGHSRCLEIFELKISGTSEWSTIADRLGGTVGATKEAWRRCCESLRRWANENRIDPGFPEGGD